MLRIGSPNDVTNYIFTDDGELIYNLHRQGIQPEWKDYDGCVYFKKSRRLEKALKKLDIDIESVNASF